MLESLSDKCACILIKNRVIDETQKAVYIYGFELFFSTFFAIFTMGIIAMIYHKRVEFLVFLLFFIPIRLVTEGYHAKTYRSCFILTNSIFFSVLFLSKIMARFEIYVLIIILYFASECVIVISSSIVSPRYRIHSEKRRKNKVRKEYILFLEFLLISCFCFGRNYNLLITATLTQMAVASLILITRRKKDERNIICDSKAY